MRLILIPSWYPAFKGDIHGSFFREQALALKRHGHDVAVIDVKLQSPKSWKTWRSILSAKTVEVDEGLVTFRHNGINWFPKIPRLRQRWWLRSGIKLFKGYVSKHGNPDVIHAHAIFDGGLLAKAISDKYGIPFVITEHSSAFARDQIDQEQRHIAQQVALSAARRFAVSDAFCNFLRLNLGVTTLTWEEMPNVVSQRFVDADAPLPHEKDEQFTFLNIAHLTENKAVNNLISAFANGFGHDSNAVLRIGGDGVERPRLEAQAHELGIAERVEFLGALSRQKVLAEMSNANIFVLSSRYETFGVVVIEALALGLPVIATECGGPESIVRKQDGLLVPSEDVPALAEAMKKMHANYDDYDPVEIRSACLERYSENTIARRLSKVYQEVITACSKDATES